MGGYRGFSKGNSLLSYAFFKRTLVTKSRSQTYLPANLSLRETQSYIFVLPDKLNLKSLALRERRAHFPKCYLTTFRQRTLLKSNFGQIRHCKARTPASCKTLANSFYSYATGALKMNNERKRSGQGTLCRSLAKVSAIIITVCTQSGCVLSYSLSQSSEETRVFGTTFLEDRTVQIYSINIPLSPHYIFIKGTRHRHNEGRDAAIMAVLLFWDWK